MKTFRDYLIESRRVYQFKLGFAGELPEGFDGKLETALGKFGLVKLSAGKKTPIQERPLDFPNLQNTEVTYFDAEVEYPTTQQVLAGYLGDVCRIDRGCIVVRSPHEPLELYQNVEETDVYEPLLNTKDMGGVSAQGDVGQNRVMDLLKELEADRKERDNDPIDSVAKGSAKEMKPSENTTSVQGAT